MVWCTARRLRPMLVLALALLLLALAGQMARAQAITRAELARGRYLVQFGGCIDCHAPGYFWIFLGQAGHARRFGRVRSGL